MSTYNICIYIYYACIYICMQQYAYIIHVHNYIQSYKYVQKIYPQVSLVGQDDQFAAKKLPTGLQISVLRCTFDSNLVRSL